MWMNGKKIKLDPKTKEESTNETREALILAPKKQAEGEVAVHLQILKCTPTMLPGIGEHSDITEAVIEELNKLAASMIDLK